MEAQRKSSIQRIQFGILPSLPLYEIYFYYFVWIYTLYVIMEKVYFVALDFKSYYLPGNFAEGWSILNREKDVSEYEWTVWANKYVSLIPWTIAYIVISQFLWLKKPKLILYFYVLFSTATMFKLIGFLPTTYLLIQSLIMFPTYLLRSKIFCWIIGSVLMLYLNIHPFSQILEYIVDIYSVEEYIMSVVTAWLNIRCLSFCLHRCSESRKSKSIFDDLKLYLGFCFYFPLLYTGPLMMFSDFERDFFASKPKWNKIKILMQTANVLRYIFWFIFNEVALHYVYVHALRMHPNFVLQSPRLALNGLGYTISQFFMTKYTVLYGLPGAIAQLEHFEPPEKPKCVARIHLYSDMWRYFDRGLYNFFKRYIYIPALGNSQNIKTKILATTLSFLFVFVWHGSTFVVFIWAFLNYIEVIIEMLVSLVDLHPRFIKFEETWISPTWSRRIRALLSVPLLYLGCISNFYFLVGYECTTIIIDRLILKAPLYYIAVQSLCLYCICQVSIESKNWELQRISKVKGV